jgi:adenosylmethionine-8-amino-7-oxononanoate aminotransferase
LHPGAVSAQTIDCSTGAAAPLRSRTVALSFQHQLARPAGALIPLGHGLQSIAADRLVDRSLTFCPPLITTDRQVDQIIDTLAVAASE